MITLLEIVFKKIEFFMQSNNIQYIVPSLKRCQKLVAEFETKQKMGCRKFCSKVADTTCILYYFDRLTWIYLD